MLSLLLHVEKPLPIDIQQTEPISVQIRAFCTSGLPLWKEEALPICRGQVEQLHSRA